MTGRTVGVEEELLLVDPATGRPRARAAPVLVCAAGSTASSELQAEQLEIETKPCTTMDELLGEVRTQRLNIVGAAERMGVTIAALATCPLPADPSISAGERYQRLAERFGMTAYEQLTCGCHVHVGIDSDEEGVAALNQVRPWLPALLAISTNSPFWQGEDTRYASFRSQVWSRWPSAGPSRAFRDAADYDATVRAMIETGVLFDRGMIYFDARLSHHVPTLEIRIADVCRRFEDTVLVAALARALVETAARAWRAGRADSPPHAELLRLATWRAGRSGLGGELVDPRTGHPAPAHHVVTGLLDHVRPALEDAGDLATVAELVAEVSRRGTGSDEQLATYRRTGALTDVVTEAASATRPR